MSPPVILLILLSLVLGGCATTRLTTHVVGTIPPLCRLGETPLTALVLWGTAWRADQKDAPLREGMASSAISSFFGTSACYAKVEVLRSAGDRDVLELSDADALRFAAASQNRYDKVIIIRVEELGPILAFYLSPVLWSGGTDVQLRVRVLDTRTAALETDIAAHWTNGGAFVLKGTGTLKDDLQKTLTALFEKRSP